MFENDSTCMLIKWITSFNNFLYTDVCSSDHSELFMPMYQVLHPAPFIHGVNVTEGAICGTVQGASEWYHTAV